MAVLKNEIFESKARELKHPLKHLAVKPVRLVKVEHDPDAFQGLKAIPTADCEFPQTQSTAGV